MKTFTKYHGPKFYPILKSDNLLLEYLLLRVHYNQQCVLFFACEYGYEQSNTLRAHHFAYYMLKQPLNLQDPLEEIKAVFAVLIGDVGCGTEKKMGRVSNGAAITLPALRAACRRFDILLSEEELQQIMDAAEDSRGCGALGFEGFSRIMRRTAWF